MKTLEVYPFITIGQLKPEYFSSQLTVSNLLIILYKVRRQMLRTAIFNVFILKALVICM